MSHYKVIERAGDGMVIIDSIDGFGDEYKGQTWARCKSRKSGTCAVSMIDYPAGTLVYRPVTNAANRSRRINAKIIDGNI